MAAFAPTVRRIVSDAADALTPASSFDLMTDLLEPLTINVNATYLGVPDDDIPGFRHLSRQMQLAHDTDIPQLLEDFWELYHYLEDLIAGRRPLNDGLIKNLLAAREEATPPVTDGEYAALLLGSLVGGDQNVLSELSKIVFVALSHHELWELMSTNPDSIPVVTEELLRLFPLGRISTFPRIASRDVAVSGGEQCARGRRSTQTLTLPTGIRRSTPNPGSWTLHAHPSGISSSATVCTTAWARRWPAWRSTRPWWC